MPFINQCLERTLPYWIPAIFLWLLAPFQVIQLYVKYRKRCLDEAWYHANDDENNESDAEANAKATKGSHWKTKMAKKPPPATIAYNWYNVTRLAVVAIIATMYIIRLVKDTYYYAIGPDAFDPVPTVNLLAWLISALTFVSCSHRRNRYLLSFDFVLLITLLIYFPIILIF